MALQEQKECFAVASEENNALKLSEDKRTIRHLKNTHRTSYGAVRFPSHHNQCTCTWTFKAEKFAALDATIAVGIQNSKVKCTTGYFYGRKCTYALELGRKSSSSIFWEERSKRAIDAKIQTGSIIILIADMRSLTFSVQCDDAKVVSKNIQSRDDLTYRMAVYTTQKNTTITLTNFTVTESAVDDGDEKQMIDSSNATSNTESNESLTTLKQKLESMAEEKTISEAKIESLENLVRSLRGDLKVSKDENHKVVVENLSLTEQMLAMKDDEKEREQELQSLREEVKRLRIQQLDESKYLQWEHEQISSWMMSLDNGRLIKYEKTVKGNLEDEEVDGSTLGDINETDLKRWGIKKFSDIKYLLKEIQRLVSRHDAAAETEIVKPAFHSMPNEGANQGATDFIQH